MGAPVSKKHTITKILSSTMLMGTYLAMSANMGAIRIVGRTMRLTREAISKFLSSLGSVVSPALCSGSVFLKFVIRTTLQ